MMKKRALLFLLLAFAVILVTGFVLKDFISVSETPAGIQRASANITVDANPPDLIVDSPANTGYSTNQISIKYSVSDSSSGVDTVWYNIDGGNNITLEGDTIMTVQKGEHVFYIYASDKVGLVNDSEFVSFSVK